MIEIPKKYKMLINGEWSLVDLYEFPRSYTQVYSLLYSLQDYFDEYDDKYEKLQITYNAFPWIGGYSAVNFYRYLYNLIQKDHKPKIITINYSSPGYIELGLILGIAISIKKIVSNFVEIAKELNSLYNDIYKGLQNRKLMRIEVKMKEIELKNEELQFINKSSNELSKLLVFDDFDKIHKLTGNSLASLKILLSFYRRIRKLAEYQKEEKITF